MTLVLESACPIAGEALTNANRRLVLAIAIDLLFAVEIDMAASVNSGDT
jgi:hypothetical protein